MKLKAILKLAKHYLLITITLSFMFGIAGQIFNDYFLASSLLILIGSSALAIIYRQYNFSKIICIIALSIGAGSLIFQYQSKDPPQNSIYSFVTEPKIVTLQGILKSMPIYNGLSTKLTIETQYIFKDKTNQEIKCTGIVYVKLQEKLSDDIVPGDTLIVKAKLKRANGYLAPGVFYYPKFLAQKDIWITGYISSSLHIHKITLDRSFKNTLIKYQYFPEQFRYNFAKIIDKNKPDTSAIYKAILLGDRSNIPEEILEAFKKCGLMHILAISGLHMAILVSLIYLIFIKILKRFSYLMLEYNIYKIAALSTIPIIIIYSSITGGQTPVIRAVLMASLLLIATTINRKSSPLTLISFAALVILLTSPHQLETVSFQLSFVAVTSIILFLRNVDVLLRRSPTSSLFTSCLKYIIVGLQVSIIASISTMPILLYHFNRVSIVGPFVNIIIEPLICLGALPLGFFAILGGIISPELSSLFLSIGSFFIDLSVNIILLIGNFNHVEMWKPSPQPIVLILFYLSELMLLCKPKNKIIKYLSFILLTIITIIMLWSAPAKKKKEEHKLTFLDVGQGSSTLIEFKNGSNIIIDCGGWQFDTKTVGEMVVGPYLYKKRITEIDSIFISHGDSDHYNGAKFIIKHFGTKRLIVADNRIENDKFHSFILWAKSIGVTIILAKKNMIYEYGDSTIRCIDNFSKNGTRNLGAVYQVQLDKIKVLLPGDIPKKIETKLLKYKIKSDILLSPHHGSKTSNSNSFLQTIMPQLVVISSAPNKEHFPDEETTTMLLKNNLQPLLTAQNGTIELSIKGNLIKTKMVQSRDFNPLKKPFFKHETFQRATYK